MGYMDIIRMTIKEIRRLIGKSDTELQPRDILSRLVNELEQKKKLGIEENAFVPNVYAIYLSPFDFEEISPLLSGIKDQLKNKLMERIKKNRYRILSTALNLDIREDAGLMRNQVVIESSFLKEKSFPSAIREDKENSVYLVPSVVSAESRGGTVPVRKEKTLETTQKNSLTRIVENKKTKIIDNTKIRIEIVEGEGRGEVIALKAGDYTFGRGRDAGILINDKDETVSRVHFKLIVTDGRISIKDLDSANGTKVNDIDIEEAELKKGDTIIAGKVLLRVA